MDLAKLIEENIKFYDTIKPKNLDNSYTVLATLNDYTTGKLLALATGTQANLRTYQDDIEDCHAESLAKRAYKRYLLDTISGIISRYDNSKDIDQSIQELCAQSLILFITQFPCGLIKRYEGDEPLDEGGKPIRRKPGRGTFKDGRIVYVNKGSCLVKLDKWLENGLQGNRLNIIFNIRNYIGTIIVGNCETTDSFEYETNVEALKQSLTCDSKPQIVLVDNVRRDEFVYKSNKQPQPVALVWWSSSPLNLPGACNQSKRCKTEFAGTLEMIVDGRKRGLTKKQSSSKGIRSNNLQISSQILRRDLDNIEQLYLQSKSGG